MRPLLSPEEMGRADRAAIEAGTHAEALMDRAGRAVARAVIRLLGGRYRRTATVVCGKGNNGGDGFVAARILAREGLGVRCLFVGDVSSLTGAPEQHLRALKTQGVAVDEFDASALDDADVVVDALFGTGFRGRVEGAAADAIEALNRCAAPAVAVDIPSGVEGATGAAHGPAVRAQVTVAMAAEKIGTAVGTGAALAGAVEVADIGIPVRDASVHLIERSDAAGVLPRRAPEAHKRSVGWVALLGGSGEIAGAPLLAARGAVRAGAGYATLGTTRSVKEVVPALIPELLSRAVTDADVLGPEALGSFGDVLGRADALAIGPGIGTGPDQEKLMEAVVAELEMPVVIDADGLNVLAGRSELLRRRSAPCVLTPHPAELARLLGQDVGKIQADRIAAARDAARDFGSVVALKGFRTVVAEPGGRAVVNTTGGPELATAGTGDVLTGVVAALLAARLAPFEATWAATYLHGVAGRLAATGTEAGTLAWDVAEALPEAIRIVREG